MPLARRLLAGAALVATAVLTPAVTASAATKPTIVIGATNFPEQAIVANAYADVLAHAGYPVQVKANLGTRAVVEPALAHGQLDIEPDYAGTLLIYLDPADTKAADQLSTAVPALKKQLSSSGATVLNAAPAIDSNVFVVTKATASKYHLTTVSNLKKDAGQFILGGPPECPTRPTCLLGLQKVYGLHFASFKSLDEAGPISVAALEQDQVQVVELFSSDGNVVQNGFVALQDDKHLQPADYLIPVIRKSVDTPQVQSVLNKLSAKLTTAQLSDLNIKVNGGASPATVAQSWVMSEGLG
jgi:osmoprotectant transport system substrate-binding protein